MRAAVVVTWTHPFPGREQKALEYAAQVGEFWSRQAEAGHCAAPETYVSENATNIWLVQGDRDELLRISETEEARLLTMKGVLLLEAFRLEIYYAGGAAVEFMTQFGKALTAIE